MTDSDAAREAIRRSIRLGYERGDDLADNAHQVADDLDDDDVEQWVSEELEARRSEEESWSEPTDHDRVVAALAELDEAGVIAREDFGATHDDAVANVREAAEDGGDDVLGFVTFSRQDAAAALEHGRLRLTVEAFEPGNRDRVVRLAREAFERQGLRLRFEDAGCVVEVPDWRVRLFSGDADRASLAGWSDLWGEDWEIE